MIESIDLSHNGISDEGMQALSVAFRRLPHLKILRLNNNGFGSDGASYLISALRQTKSVTRLELCQVTVPTPTPTCLINPNPNYLTYYMAYPNPNYTTNPTYLTYSNPNPNYMTYPNPNYTTNPNLH